MLKASSRKTAHSFATLGVIPALTLYAALALSGCAKNDNPGPVDNTAPSRQPPVADTWRKLETPADSPFVLEINLSSIKPDAQNADWREYRIQLAPSALLLSQDDSADSLASYTLIDNTMDCAGKTSRANAQRTYLEPYEKGQQVSSDPVEPVFTTFGGTAYEDEIISLVCK